VSNLNHIRLFISADSLFYAEKTVLLLYDLVKKLSNHPEIGMVVSIKSKYVLRRILVKSFIIIYCFYLNKIYIVAVNRQTRRLPADVDFIENYF